MLLAEAFFAGCWWLRFRWLLVAGAYAPLATGGFTSAGNWWRGIRLALLQATVDECSNPVLGQHPRQLPGTILLGKAEKDARHRRGLLGLHDGGPFGLGHGEDCIPTGRAEEASRLQAKFFFTRKRGQAARSA